MPKYLIERTMWVAFLAWLVAAPAALATPGGGNSAATITGSFADSCRDFAAHSSKDISYVDLHYVARGVFKDESINSPDHAIDGGAGDEIAFAIVKSGTTTEQFDCVPSNRAPTALLEIQTPPIDQTFAHCYDFFTGPGGGLLCEQSSPRTVWTSAGEIPDNGYEGNLLLWGCGAFTASCPFTFSFRGTGSSDPDGDITSWSLDFGDGTSASGSWSTAPPTEVMHEYSRDPFGNIACGVGVGSYLCMITLTVTDSAGQSHSVAMLMAFVDQHPD